MDAKVEKKLARLASNIKKSRKDKKKEAAQFEEINRLLQDSDEDSLPAKELELPPEISSELLIKDLLPLTPPSIEIFDERKLFSHFDENTIKLELFLESGVKSNVFGKEVHLFSDHGLRKLIQHAITGDIIAEIDKSPPISLYVFYLLSVHSNAKFVLSCYKFLKHRRFKISSDNILSVLVNFGSTIEELCDSSFEIDLPECQNATEKYKKRQLPLFNLKMVAELLIHYTDNNLVNFDWHFKHLIRALVKITLDPNIKNSGVYIVYSTLFSKLVAKAAPKYGSVEVIDWLHLENAPLAVQVEVCRIFQPINQELHQELIVRVMNFIFNPKSLKIFPLIKVKDLKRILEETKKKSSSLVDTYYLLQLMLIVLPTIDVTLKESHEINALLASLESKILRKEDSVDVVRIKLDIAKLRNLIISKIDCRFAMNELIQLSPIKASKIGVI